MTTSVNTTLIALLLALKDLDSPLNQEEQEALKVAAERLQIEPNNWKKDHEPDILAVIQANPTLDQLYRTAKSQLETLNKSIPVDLLPTKMEVEQETEMNKQPEKRGYTPSDNYDESNEINNMVISILGKSNPSETVKKLNRLEQLKQFLKIF